VSSVLECVLRTLARHSVGPGSSWLVHSLDVARVQGELVRDLSEKWPPEGTAGLGRLTTIQTRLIDWAKPLSFA
jgi:hypothetical protein